MYEVLPDLLKHWAAGETVAIGTVVATFRSAPRLPGASMLVGPSGGVVGSVSGGCVEGAVYELAQQVRTSGEPAIVRYGVSDDDALAVGLTCGGILEVYVDRVDRVSFPDLGDVAGDVSNGRPVAIATIIDHPDPSRIGRRLIVRPESSNVPCSGSLGRADDAVCADARGLLAAGHSGTLSYGPDGQCRGEGMRVFVWAAAAPPRMLVFGAIDFAAAVARVGSFLGYQVTVCDARPVFATAARIPAAHDVVVNWPHKYLQAEVDAGRIDGRTVICVLTHDPKFDVPVLEVALRLPEVEFVGAMGSRKTHEDRMARLRQVGVSETELARLRSPIGLDLGARTPEETAVSIAAEVISVRSGGCGQPLRLLSQSIHHLAPSPRHSLPSDAPFDRAELVARLDADVATGRP